MIPAFINPRSGTAKDAREAIGKDSRFALREAADVPALARALEAEVEGGARRVLVSGGDGTVAAAAAAIVRRSEGSSSGGARRGTELAILPGGTLNHFARDHGIPADDPAAALEAAAGGEARPADVAFVNDRLFLNTSSVGAYVTFVRTRERLERRLGYYLASLVAAVRILARLRTARVELEVDGVVHRYQTPLVFIGLGERELKLPKLGGRVENGRRGLHVIVVRGRTRARLMALAMVAAGRGVRWISRTPHADSFITDRCTIEVPGREQLSIAVDGEIVRMDARLEYRVARDALMVVRGRDDGMNR